MTLAQIGQFEQIGQIEQIENSNCPFSDLACMTLVEVRTIVLRRNYWVIDKRGDSDRHEVMHVNGNSKTITCHAHRVSFHFLTNEILITICICKQLRI